MFSNLFEDGETPSTEMSEPGSSGADTRGTSFMSDAAAPPNPRQPCGLCGIYNQGATCYLNSLLQTLVMTPEFRESLYELGSTELGHLKDKDKQGQKVRVIPIHLQNLFARLLLLNAQAASTTALTDSFGWTNSEELVQHDVQELNRILFSAVEDSLVGTSGQQMIHNLYHGSVVNQIVCQTCGRISEREEDFLDLSVAVGGCGGLEESLSRNYVDTESLSGNNQYRCEICKKLVDAKKGAKIRHLPPLLTISLLRFSFNFEKLERFKETGKFIFPLEIDMGPFVENLSTAGNTEYELFSVVSHSGGAHGGHYTAYIRDIDNLGHWTHPDEEEIQLSPDPTTGEIDLIQCDSPVLLIQAILARRPDRGIAVDRLCAEITKQTGVPWSRRFKKQNGPINKFLRRHDDKFTISDVNYVTLVDPSTRQSSSQQTNEESAEKPTKSKGPPPPEGQRWFYYNDNHVHPVYAKELENQFTGKSSAYMLFYRRRDLIRPLCARGRPDYGMPDDLVRKIMEENDKLQQQRLEYETVLNTIKLKLLFAQLYSFKQGALQANDPTLPHLEISIDKRKNVSDLLQAINETYEELMPAETVLHFAKQLPAGVHVYHCVSGDLDKVIMETSICAECRLLVWDGQQINGENIPIGPDAEPIQLTVLYGNSSQLLHGFPRTMVMGELLSILCTLTHSDLMAVNLTQLITKEDNVCMVHIQESDHGKTLQEMNLTDGAKLVLENSSDASSGTVSMCTDEVDTAWYTVENRCVGGVDYTVTSIKVHNEATVQELKALILAQLCENNVNADTCRVRFEDDNMGLLPPVAEAQSLQEAGLKPSHRVILEHGQAPLSDQLSLTFSCEVDSSLGNLELIMGRQTSIRQLMDIMVKQAGRQGDDWHLRRTNWCGEAADILDDLDLTLVEVHLKNGDHILLEPGELPPKGHMKLSIDLYTSVAVNTESNGIMSYLKDGINGLPAGVAAPVSAGMPEGSTSGQPIPVGSIVIAKHASLEELKLTILTLPSMENISVATMDFMRLRLVEQKRLTTVLRDHRQTLQRLKVKTGMTLGLQLLPQEESLSVNDILLDVKVRIPEIRAYEASMELLWDASEGATIESLRQKIADSLALPAERLVLAKYITDKYDWKIIQDAPTTQSKGQRGKKKRKNNAQVNLKRAPYTLRDGTIIAVKDLEHDPLNQDDFSTQFDIDGRERLKQEAEERKRRREELRAANAAIGFGQSAPRRELAIKIHVDDFR